MKKKDLVENVSTGIALLITAIEDPSITMNQLNFILEALRTMSRTMPSK